MHRVSPRVTSARAWANDQVHLLRRLVRPETLIYVMPPQSGATSGSACLLYDDHARRNRSVYDCVANGEGSTIAAEPRVQQSRNNSKKPAIWGCPHSRPTLYAKSTAAGHTRTPSRGSSTPAAITPSTSWD